METNLFTNSAAAAANNTNPLQNGANATQDMFTKLLVAQIKNQDPTDPAKPESFVQQLTQLSQTEALQNLANLTSSNASVLQSMQVLAMGAQVGSDVMANVDQVQLGDTKVKGEVVLGASSTKTTLVLTGVNGVEHNIELGSKSAGAVAFALDPTALGLPPGTYKMKVVTSTGEEPPVDISGRLNSVRLGAGGAIVLNVANVGEVSPAAITAFNGKAATTSTVAAAGATSSAQ
ncbi:flagellar hook capping FlgD N-terminal domain-containing protein [Massilia endophytica]|uniref:flagellar hook capping FlgD N-terminal domain-containing protein n=1 Tax=Massilia endophytica TaxID=2899220 RepID=UPI001E33E664|nr:flagellar hook capping FlgD N-terminal domain-containing protein [Massilia endophytica]UGQ48979.1 flagellar basal body rod modification protein [Massilia endophytica]